MLLSNTAIRRHRESGNIVIEPYNEANLGTCSYDVTLGEWYYRETRVRDQVTSPQGSALSKVYNPYDKDHVSLVWGQEPEQAELIVTPELRGIPPASRVIWIEPGETLLCHTNEFIGGQNCVTTMMKARSSMGRNFTEICKDAGWGDIGYTNRWTMEVTNNSRFYTIPLVVGRRVAQIVFFETEPIERPHDDYVETGKYQEVKSLQALVRDWKPAMMLPRMHKDREVRTNAS